MRRWMTRRSQREGREVRREWDKQSKTRSSTLTIQMNKGLKFETVEKQKKTRRSLTLNLLLNEGTRLKLDREYQLDSKQGYKEQLNMDLTGI